MIRITVVEPTDAAWQAWRVDCDAKQAAFNAATEAWHRAARNPAAAPGPKPKADSEVYGAQKEDFYIRPDGPFRGKCAYCEEDIYANQRGDIEHFRPKGAVKGANGRPVKVDIDGVRVDHPGYYWLAYDWRNLLPSCQLCNQVSTRRSGGRRIGKADYFPLADEHLRATAPGEEAREQPLLINPAEEDPATWLHLDPTGVVAAAPGSGTRGEVCIATFGLNERELPSKRARVYQDTFNLMLKLVTLVLEDPDGPRTEAVRARLRRIEGGAEEYTAAARLALRHARARIAQLVQPIL